MFFVQQSEDLDCLVGDAFGVLVENNFSGQIQGYFALLVFEEHDLLLICLTQSLLAMVQPDLHGFEIILSARDMKYRVALLILALDVCPLGHQH